MCISPIKIKSRVNHFDLHTPLYYHVPCGKCSECQQMEQDSWFVRCFFEWQQAKQTFFYTLTFNNEHLPYRYGMPVFNKRLVQKFLDRLRKLLFKYGVKLKYLVSSEFGELYKRPHHHALFFLDKQIPPMIFYRLVEQAWKYGFVKYGDNIGVVNSTSGIRYVTKYVSKDFSYTSEFDSKFFSRLYLKAQQLLSWLHLRYPDHKLDFNQIVLHADMLDHKLHYDWLSFDKKDYYANEELRDFCDKFIRKVYSRFRFNRPFHLQSTKLGCSILDLPSHVLDSCSIPVLLASGDTKEFPLPRYFKRKLWYDCVENENDHKCNRFVLNEAGKKHLMAKLEDKINTAEERLSSVFLNMQNITTAVLPALNKTSMKFNDFTTLHYWLKNFDLNIHNMAIYSSIFRGRVCPFPYKDIRFTDANLPFFMPYVEACLKETAYYDYGKIYRDEYNYKELYEHTFDCHPYFQIYETALEVIEVIQSHLKECQSNAYKTKELLTRKTRDLFNKPINLKTMRL